MMLSAHNQILTADFRLRNEGNRFFERVSALSTIDASDAMRYSELCLYL